MTKTFKTPSVMKRVAAFASGLVLSLSAFCASAAGGGALQQSGTDLNDKASLQRGAQLFMNYCSGCHSLRFLRTSRMAQDLGLSEDEVMANLNLTDAKFG